MMRAVVSFNLKVKLILSRLRRNAAYYLKVFLKVLV